MVKKQFDLLCSLIIFSVVLFFFSGNGSVPACAATVTRQQKQTIQAALQKENANAIVLVGSSNKHPAMITNRATIGKSWATALDPQQLFPIASFQKAITGVAIQQLINQDKLSLNTPVSKYLPQIQNSQQITIRNLLTHTSGLADRKPIANRPLTPQESIKFTESNYLVINHPGQWHYANVNYGLLAIIISKVSHQSYQTYVKKHIFKPNHITGMKFNNQISSAKQISPSLTAQGFKLAPDEFDAWRYLQREMSAEYGAGQILATPNSYWQFLNKVILKQNGILKQYQQISFSTTDNPYYGGFYLHPNELHANGSYDGYACTVFSNIKTKQTIILFSNNITLKQCRRLGYELYHIYYGTEKQGFPY